MSVKLRSFIEDLSDDYYQTKDNALNIMYLDPYDRLEDLRISIQNRDVTRICEHAIAQAMAMNCDMRLSDGEAYVLVSQQLDQMDGPVTDEAISEFISKTIVEIVD